MLKNRARLSSTIDKNLFKKIKKLSEKTRIPVSRLLDEALEDLFKKYEV
jgi:mRNA-degrading endonuclease RelE of RelBE toxin-antitoxin system